MFECAIYVRFFFALKSVIECTHHTRERVHPEYRYVQMVTDRKNLQSVLTLFAHHILYFICVVIATKRSKAIYVDTAMYG